MNNYHISYVEPGDKLIVSLRKRSDISGLFVKKLGKKRQALPSTSRISINSRFVCSVISNDYDNRRITIEVDTNLYKTNVYQLELIYSNIKELYKLTTMSNMTELEKQLSKQNPQVNSRMEGLFFPEDARFVKIQIPSL